MNAGPTSETRPVQKLASCRLFRAASRRSRWLARSTIGSAGRRSRHGPSVLGAVLVAIGLFIAMLAILQNSFAASRVTVEERQRVISTGLYGLVRHPMYLGLLIMMIGAPLALDSFWGLVLIVPALVVVRHPDPRRGEAASAELTGYDYYADKVRAPVGAVRVVTARAAAATTSKSQRREGIMKTAIQTAATSVIGLGVFLLMVFLPAGTFDYWRGWAFIAVFAAATLIPSVVSGRNESGRTQTAHAGGARRRDPAAAEDHHHVRIPLDGGDDRGERTGLSLRMVVGACGGLGRSATYWSVPGYSSR